MTKKSQDKLKLISNSYLAVGVFLIVLGTAIIIAAKYPQVWYSLEINTVENEFVTLTEPLEVEKKEYEEQKEIEDTIKWDRIEPKIPPLDFNLPQDNYVIIDKVGINTLIHQGQDYEKLLEKGVWKVYDFGSPEDESVMILVAHRFGYFNWTQEQRDTHSFFHLPNTRVGDRVEIIWNQRRYIYEISKLEESTKITDYNVDLILYTCKLYNSPVRIFRYANRVN